jgi:hypothetical protein
VYRYTVRLDLLGRPSKQVYTHHFLAVGRARAREL